MNKAVCLLLMMCIIVPLLVMGSGEPPTIAIVGSSVAAGWGGDRHEHFDCLNGWAFLLSDAMEQYGYKVINLSIPGNNTIDVLERFERDVYTVNPDIAIIALSLSNEGLGRADGDSVMTQFEVNMKGIIDKCEARGIKPVIAHCYANNAYDKDMYEYTLAMNKTIESFNYPAINLLNAMDDGSGHFPDGTYFDADHPSSKGHKEMFLGIEPNMFNAILEASYPGRSFTAGGTLTSVHTPMYYFPDSPMHSFTLGMSIAISQPSQLFDIECLDKHISLSVNNKGELIVEDNNTGHAVSMNKPFRVFVVNNYAMNEMSVFLEDQCIYRNNAQYEPVMFKIMGNKNKYGDIMLYRIPIDAGDISTLTKGTIPVTGLSVYSNGDIIEKTMPNLGLSGQMFSSNINTDSMMEMTRNKLLAFDSIPDFSFQSYYNIVDINNNAINDLIGKYYLNDDVFFEIKAMDNKLWVSPNGMDNIELLPLSEHEFIAYIIGPEARIIFSKTNSSDIYNLMEFSMDGYIDSMYR